MFKYYLCIPFILFIFSSGKADKPPVHKWTAKDPFEQKVFIENLGQYALTDKAASADILFGARQDGMQYFFTKDGLWIKYIEKVERTEKEKEEFANLLGEKEEKGEEDNIIQYKFVDRFYRMEFVGAGLNTTISAEDKVSQYYSYYTEQKVNVQAKAYKKITYKNLYPNIDMEFYFPEDKQGFKYNLILHPGADISQIQIHYPFIKNISLNDEGNINIKSFFGDFTDHAPMAYDRSTNKPVACSFILKKNTVSFSAYTYNKTKGLFIDPWTTTPVFAGGNNAFDVDWDLAGNVYAYGGTSPYQLVKFNAAGIMQWMCTANFTNGRYYGDFAVDRNSGSAYLTDGYNYFGAEVKKVSSAGTLVATYPGNPSFREMWRIAFSPCANAAVIAGGGTSENPAYTGCYLDTNLVNMKPVDVINSGGSGFHDMWGITLDATGSAYFCSAKTQIGTPGFDNVIYKVPIPALTPIMWQAPTSYSFAEVGSVTYGSSATNGFNGAAISSNSFYTYDSYIFKKWNSATGGLIDSININGTSKKTMAYGGLTADQCDHLFLGLNNSIVQYDGNSMTQTDILEAAGTVFDINLGNNNILYSCGHGFVTATQLTLQPCTVLQVQDSITNAYCTNPVGSATLTVTGGKSPYKITWNTMPVQTGSVVTNLPSGTYVATVTDNSCPPLKITDTVVINLSGIFAVTPVITNIKCNGAGTGALDIMVTGNVVPSYSWSTGSNVSGISNLAAGTYSVIVDAGSGCNMMLSLNVTEPPPLTYTLSQGTLKCFGDTTSISIAIAGGTPSNSHTTYTVNWNPPDAEGLIIHGIGSGNHSGTITDDLGCILSFSTSIVQPPQIIPAFTADQLAGCPPLEVYFTDNSVCSSSQLVSWNWNFGNGSLFAGPVPKGVVSYNNDSPTSTARYDVSLTVVNMQGCSASVVKNNYINVYPRTRAGFEYISEGNLYEPTQTFHFYDHSLGASAVNYYLGDIFADPLSLNYTSNNNPVHQYQNSDADAYFVTQWVSNPSGCKDSVTRTIQVKPAFSFYMPNSFSPNGDGVNEYFIGSGMGIDNSTYNLTVFDRWGNHIFRSNDLEKGWDGKLNGNEVSENMYVWKVNFKDTDGFMHEYHGTVSVMK